MRYILAAAALLTLAAGVVAAQTAPGVPGLPCAPTALMNEQLRGKYGEAVVSAGVSQGGLVYVTANAETGTFTVLLQRPDGISCILVAGRGWASKEPVRPGQDT